MRQARTLLLPVLLAALCACASGGAASSGGGAAPAPKPQTGASAITREEIEDAHLTDAYSVVRRLRPGWLRRRGPDVASAAQDVKVYLDTSPRGYTQALRAISAASAFEIRYVDPISARIRYGPGHEQGVIVVSTGRP